MKKGAIFLIFLAHHFVSTAQTSPVFSADFVHEPLISLIRQIEQGSSYRFYYIDSWIDTVKLDISFRDQTVPEILEKAFAHTLIRYHILNDRIVLTQNVYILDAVDPTLFVDYRDGKDLKYNYSFQREYIPPQGVNANQIMTVYEIGVKQLTAVSGNAILVGTIRERKSGEPLPGAVIYFQENNKGITTNAFGFYSIALPPGAYTLTVQYTGMKQLTQRVVLHSDGKLDMALDEDIISLKEVTIESDRDANISSLQMGVNSVNMKTMKNIPKVLGENDILKVMLTLPGVKSIGEGASGLNVRGGNADQNLMLINEATVYNSSHFLGFFSIFNADAIKSSELYKSGIPAQYGGRLSSVFDMQMKDGNQKKFSGQGGIGLVTSHLTLEMPIIKDKTSIMVGGRTTYSDWVLQQIPPSALRNSGASFYDVFGRITHNMNDKNSFYLSYYYSKDKYHLSSDSLFSYHNALASFQWRHLFNNNLQSVLNVTRSDYHYAIDYQKIALYAFNFGFDIHDTNFKWDWSYYKGDHKIDFGIQSKLYELNPGYLQRASSESIVTPVTIDKEKGLENAIYLADNVDINSKLSLSLGLRYSFFYALGPASVNTYRQDVTKSNSSITDTLHYPSNKVMKTYKGPEYRISARYKLSNESSVKFSYNRTRQYIHMLSNNVSVSPTNTWKLSDPNVGPQLADQVSVGFYQDVRNKTLEFSMEAYYRWMQHILDYKTGAKLLLNENIEKDILRGQGKAYGIEFLLRKRNGKLNGWLSYTYSRTFIRLDSQFPQEIVNGGQYFPANYDKPHDLSLVSNYKITRRYSFSFNFAYSTGRPITYPVGLYKFEGTYRINYSDRNQYRIPDYIRADIGFNIEGNHKVKKLAHSFWSISIYNLLGRRNPYSVYFVAKDGKINGYQLSIFGAPIPTISYNFKF